MGSETAESIKDAFSFISERGVLGGLYLGTLIFGLIFGSHQIVNLSEYLIWLAVLAFVSGFIITSISYELLMPVFRPLTSAIARYAFNKTVTGSQLTGFTSLSYKQIREFREIFRSKADAAHLGARITEEEKLRQTTTYFTTSSIVALLSIYWLSRLFHIDDKVVKIESVIVAYILIATLLGQVFRSFSFGRAIAFAYIKEKKT